MPLANGNARIFLAEDNAADVYLLREALDQTGIVYRLEVAENGELASTQLQRFHSDPVPDLIVLDLNLPRLSGSELLSVIRAIDKLRSVPVVIFTSSDSPYDREQTARLGATMYVRKPSNLDEFLAVGGILADIIDQPAQ